MKLKDLAVEHSYYCSESNYYSSKSSLSFSTMTEFLNEFESSDIDLNLCFRWDVKDVSESCENEEAKGVRYNAEVFLILQRKGIFLPCTIDSIVQEEVERFVKYITNHKKHLDDLWDPIRLNNNEVNK